LQKPAPEHVDLQHQAVPSHPQSKEPNRL
jgi:hypothetical protein